jgi:hypothetical protein
MHISTKVTVLKAVWALLRELGLEGLLTGDGVKVDPVKLLNSLLIENQLSEFIEIITEGTVHADDLELKEVVELVVNFTQSTGDAFKPLVALLSE